MLANLDGLLWLLALLVPLLFLQRWLHREIQIVFLLLTRRTDIALMLFSLLFFPGVLLHEGSHFLVARLLGVRTGRFSLIPRPLQGGRLQLGYVETAGADWVRESLIGLAPLLTGGAFVAYIGLARLGLEGLWEQLLETGTASILPLLADLPGQPDFWLWFYLAVVVSSTMMPSASDRRAWLPLIVIIVVLLAGSLLAGAGPWLATYLAPLLNHALRAVAVVFGISVVVHMAFLPPIWLAHRVLSRLTNLDVA